MSNDRDLAIEDLLVRIDIHEKIIQGAGVLLKKEMERNSIDLREVRKWKAKIAESEHNIKAWKEELARLFNT